MDVQGQYDLALLHTVLEYLPDPATALSIVAGLLRPSGLLSIVFPNRHAEPLRRAFNDRQVAQVRAALVETTFTEKLFGVPRRLFSISELRGLLQSLGMRTASEKGIRVFADYLTAQDDGNQPADLFALEVELADLLPYKQIARYWHIVSCK
jgi:S-adenosylmethionine-dependent methyltransferase